MPSDTDAGDDAPDGARDATPRLALDGFNGPLDHLLALARAQKIDLSAISLAALTDQLAAALHDASGIPIGWKGDWVVMAAWLVQLRSLLLLPAEAPAQQEAAAEADSLRGRLIALEDTRALADWLERRPRLGHDVFARGRPEPRGVAIDAAPALDVVGFLWASLALFDDDAADADTVPLYRPVSFDLYPVAAARARILRVLEDMPDGASFEKLLPDMETITAPAARAALRRRSAWSSTFVASLELARQGDVLLAQEEAVQRGEDPPIQVRRASPGRDAGAQ